MPTPFHLINPLLGNPLLRTSGIEEVVDKLKESAGFKASREEQALEAAITQVAKEKGTTPWTEALNLRREAGKQQKKFIAGNKDLKNLEHKFYARETASLGPEGTAQMYMGSFAHPALKVLGFRGPDNREGSVREVVANLQGTGQGMADFVRAKLGLDPIE